MKNKKIISKIIGSIYTEDIDNFNLKKIYQLIKESIEEIPLKNESDKNGNRIYLVRINHECGDKGACWYYSVLSNSKENAIKKTKKDIAEMEIPKEDWRKRISWLKGQVKKDKKQSYECMTAFAPKSFRKDDEDRKNGYLEYFEGDERL